ncbi:hypothetical protein EV424DRAFT_1313811, partial [Suillus variegatus]
REIRCMDLGGEALGSYKARQGGCTHIQVGDLNIFIFCYSCTGCGMEFSKVMLRQNAYIEIKGLPS